MPSLFEQVVDCCGLAPTFASKVVRQACERRGVVAETMGPAELIRALPQIHHALSVFLDPPEVARKVAAMRALVRGSWPSFPAVTLEASSQAPQEDPKTKSTSKRS
jgi:hypothetical protein